MGIYDAFGKKMVLQEKLNAGIYEHKNIIIYGAGYNGIRTLARLREEQKEPLCFCDADKEKHGRAIDGVKVISPEGLYEMPKDSMVLVTPHFHVFAITNFLKGMGFNNILYSAWEQANSIYCADVHQNNSSLLHYKEMLKDADEKIAFVKRGLADGKSVDIFNACISSWVYGKNEELEKHRQENQYFAKDIIQLEGDEVFIDCGAAYGDTCEVFYQITGGKYGKYIAFEPNTLSCLAFESLAKTKEWHNLSISALGISKNKGEVRFVMAGDGSHISENGEAVIYTDSLDNLLAHEEKVSYIKMDIEGAELDALIGAENTIKEHRPKLAVCLYHNIADLWEIPYYSMNTHSNYKYYIRQHACISETVLYAIPKLNLQEDVAI